MNLLVGIFFGWSTKGTLPLSPMRDKSYWNFADLVSATCPSAYILEKEAIKQFTEVYETDPTSASVK